MEQEEYFNLMKQTGKLTYKRVGKYLDKEIKEKTLRDFINTFISGRLSNKRGLRSMTVRGIWETLRKDNWEDALDVYAWVELWCIADYLTNDIFDNKLDKCTTKIKKDPNLFFISSAIVREVAEKALRSAAKKFNPEEEDKVVKLFSGYVNNAYHHQWIDYTNKYKGETINILKKKMDELFKKRYIDYEAGNCFGKIYEISARLFCKDDCTRTIDALRKYGENFSASLQITNDIADTVDGCYDAKNKILTYPLILTMIKTEKKVYKLSPNEIRKLFVKSGAFDESRKKAIGGVKKAKKSIEGLTKNSGTELLKSILIMIWSNKYYSILKKIK